MERSKSDKQNRRLGENLITPELNDELLDFMDWLKKSGFVDWAYESQRMINTYLIDKHKERNELQ